MLLILLGSLVGIIEGLYIDWIRYMALSFLLLLLGFFMIRKEKFHNNAIFVFLGMSLIFYSYTKWQIHSFDTKYQEGSFGDTMRIISYAHEGDYYYRYIAQNSIGDKFLVYFPNRQVFRKGEVVSVKGEFFLPDLARNTGGFNYRRYLNSQKIYGTVLAKEYYLTELSQFHLIYFLQDEMNQTFAKLFPKNEMGLVLGMMIGETKDISEDILQDFKNTGITHLLAVSGSNVMYVLACVQFIFRRLCGKRKANVIAIAFLIIFMLVSGGSSSVVRATLMATLMILADVFYQKSDTIHNIIVSAWILMAFCPLMIYDVGFILSFGGTLGIVLLSKNMEVFFDKFGKWKETLAVTCSAQLILMPIMAFYFNTFSLLSVITNLVVVPISGFITILGFIIFLMAKIFFPIAQIISPVLYLLAHFTINVAKFFGQIPFANILIVTPNIAELILFYGVIFYCLKDIKKRGTKQNLARGKQAGMVIAFFIIVEVLWYQLPQNYVMVHCVDVGQGDAIYVETNHHKNILVDGGGSKTYDVGENILLPYLLDKRVTHIHIIFSSHSDADHLYGILTVVERLHVDQVVIAKGALGYEKLYALAKERGTKVIELEKRRCCYRG